MFHCDYKLPRGISRMANSSVFGLMLMILSWNGIYGEHIYIGQSETFHLGNVPDNLEICTPQNRRILTKTGTSCQSPSSRVYTQECSNAAVSFILSDLSSTDSGIYHLCSPTPSGFTWSHSLDVQGYPVEVIANPLSPVVKNGEQVTLTCKNGVPQNIGEVRVTWIVENVPLNTTYYWYNQTDTLTVDISNTNDCDMYTCQLIRGNEQLSTSNKPPFKINKIEKSEVSYTGSSITFIIPATVFENGMEHKVYHSSGGCLYHINIQDWYVNKCTDNSYINHNRIHISIKKNTAVFLTLDGLSPFDSGRYKVDDGQVWNESLLVWGYESSIVATPSLPIYGVKLSLTCNYDLPYSDVPVTQFKWYNITNTGPVLLNNTQKTYSIDSNLTEDHQGIVFQCTPVYQYIGFSPSQYTINMFIPPKIKRFSINGIEESFEVNDGELIQFKCEDISSFPVSRMFYLTHDPTKQATPTVDLTEPMYASCNMDGIWTCHVFYEYNDGDRTMVLEDKMNITLMVNKCVARIETNDTQLNIPVKYGESTILSTLISGTIPSVELDGLPVRRSATSGLPSISAQVTGRYLVILINMADADVFSENLTVTVRNEFGNDSKIINLQPTGRPQPPYNLTVLEIGGDYVTIQWQPGFRGGANQSIMIEHRNPSSDWSILNTLPTEEDTIQTYSHTDRFNPRTSYEYRVQGINAEGQSSYSNVLSVYIGNETIERNITTVDPMMAQVDNNVLAICLTVGAVTVLIFTLFMVLICTRRRKDTDERLLAVENIHRISQSTSVAEEPEADVVSDPRTSMDSGPSTSTSTSTQINSGSEPTMGSSETPYVQNAGGPSMNNNLPRLSSDYFSQGPSSRHVHFP